MNNIIRILIVIVMMMTSILIAKADVKLKKQGTATQILINGKPMLILGGELSNSAVSSKTDIDSVLPRMRNIGLNTVFIPVYWDLFEPKEAHFDFTLIDENIKVARDNKLKIVFLWFGAWKNSMSCYAPFWFKKDVGKYPRAMTSNGKSMEIASAFSENVFKADNRAFSELMHHIADVDSKENTVIMIQIENEIGMLESARDHSSLAEKTYNTQVPAELLRALKVNKKGTWQQVFGTGCYADEKFQAYYYAKYVGRLAQTARSIYNIPLYVNAAMDSRGRKPGEYPSAGPLAHLIEIWKCAAPDIDIYAPDIYDTDFKCWVAKYKRQDNPFFTPETRLGINSGVRALYTFGEVDAISFSPFAIDQSSSDITQYVTKGYNLVSQLSPLLLKYQGRGSSWGMLFDQKNPERIIEDGDNLITCRHYFTLPWDSRATDGHVWQEGGGLILKLTDNEYIIAGSGVVVVFQTKSEKDQVEQNSLGEDGFVNKGKSTGSKTKIDTFTGKRLGIGYVDQVEFDENGNMKYIRRDNGDQDHQGRHVRISCDEYKILHVKLYEY